MTNYCVTYRLLEVILILSVSLSGCKQKTFNDLEAMQNYVTRKGSPFQIKKQHGSTQFILQYLPTDLVMKTTYEELEHAKNKKDTTNDARSLKHLTKDLETQKSYYTKNLYFKLTIGFTDQNRDLIYSKRGSYNDWLQKLLFSMNDYLEIETNEIREIPMLHYRMERSYGMTSSRTFLLVFPKTFNHQKVLDAEKLTITLEEFGLGSGPIHFSFDLPFPNIEYNSDFKI